MEDRGGISGAALIDRPAEPARSRTTRVKPKVEGLEVTAYEVPTDQPESDGTLKWDSTTAIVVEAFNGRERGIGYTYGDRSVKTLIESKLCDVVSGADAMRPPTAWVEMRRALRNVGQPGEGAMAVSAVDMALWDLKARLLGLPLADALPRFRDSVPVYGSGGFTSYDADALREQARGWVRAGMRSVKIKVGREPDADPERIKVVRDVIGPNIELMVDANGAYGSVAEALQHAERFRELGIVWLEEPLPNDDLQVFIVCAGSALRESRSRPASTTGASSTRSGCSRRARSTFSSQTSLAAGASPSCCGSTESAAHTACPSPVTARLPPRRTRAARWSPSSTSSTSTTTSGSSLCSSRAHWILRAAR